MGVSYLIASELTEKQIEADVAMYLGWCSAGMPFRLLDINEQESGADKLFNVIMPIYMQFKKSEGLKPLPELRLKRRANESRLQAIRLFRSKHNLADNPTLFFGLRARAENAQEFQHNVLFAHHRPRDSYAIYVAPLYLDRERYYADLCSAPRFLSDPWDWRPNEIIDDVGHSGWLSRYDRQPFLRNHVSIQPHDRVATHNHHYAFSVSGDEVSWHSPAVLDGGPFRLSDFLSARTREFVVGDGELPSPESALRVAQSVLGELGVDPQGVFRGETPLDRLRDYGRWLWKVFDIRQVLLCTHRDFINAVRESYYP